MEEEFEEITDMDAAEAAIAESNAQSIQALNDDLQSYLKLNRTNSTFKGWLAEYSPEDVRINPRLRYEDSVQRNIWNNSNANKMFGAPLVPPLTPHESHQSCGWPSGPDSRGLFGGSKSKKLRKSRKSKRTKKTKKTTMKKRRKTTKKN
uniref:Uncharacterized protein n=1 Tax=viral metagenome TaxID=1070528 RepID=A0A6C0AXN1_9ZZZZ|tara:strand:- start:48 stop:494 length:447 start_codon:yes stop_codon:yes gene_type:complete